MQFLKSLLLVLLLILIAQEAKASFHFTEVYSEENVWRVDHFEASDGQLQDLVESRSFATRFEANAFSERVKSSSKSKIKFTNTEMNSAPLWKVDKEWDQDWEDKYAEWVGQNLTTDYFIKNNLATDCADAAYALRWIFARNNGLPAAATLAGSNVNATHLSAKTEWQSLPQHSEWQKDKRFLAAISWLLDNTYTKTLLKDAYPVEINRSTIRPGLINLISLGHTEIFNHVSYHPEEIPMGVVSSTMPKAVRMLVSRPFLDSWRQKPEDGGLLQFRWPIKSKQWAMLPREEMPFYSLEQYNEKLCENESRFAFCLVQKLGMSFNPQLILQNLKEALVNTVKQRADVVAEGFRFCKLNDCSPGTQGWEDWGTPSRDGRLLQSILSAKKIAEDVALGEIFKRWLVETKIPADGGNLNFAQFAEFLESGFISSDPRDDIQTRWASSGQAIGLLIDRMFAEWQLTRADMVEKAKPCRDNPQSCQNNLAMIQAYSTLDHDYKIRKSITAWLKISEQTEIEKKYQSLWFHSPAPWDSIEKRNASSNDKGHLLKAHKVRSAGEGFIILNQNRLYDVVNRKEIKLFSSLSSHLGFDDHTRQLYLLENHKLKLYGENHQTTGEFAVPVSMSSNEEVFNLGEGQLLIVRNSHDRGAWIVDLVRKSVSERIDFDTFYPESGEKKKYLFIGSVNRIVSLENGKVVFLDLPKFESTFIRSFIQTAPHKYFIISDVHRESAFSTLYSVQGKKFVELMREQNSQMSLQRLNSHFTLFQYSLSPGEPLKIFFDSDQNARLENHNFSGGLSGPNDEFFFFNKSPDGWLKGILLKGSNILETNVTLKAPVYLASFAGHWFSYFLDEMKYIVSDMEGQTQDTHGIRAKLLCPSASFHSFCSGTGSLLVEYWDIPQGPSSFTMLSIGLSEDWRLKESLVHVVRRSESTFGSKPSFLNFKVETGTGVNMEDDVMLWFPK